VNASSITFSQKLQVDLQQYPQKEKEYARSTSYNKLGQLAESTKRKHAADVKKKIGELHAKGFGYISIFFVKRRRIAE